MQNETPDFLTKLDLIEKYPDLFQKNSKLAKSKQKGLNLSAEEIEVLRGLTIEQQMQDGKMFAVRNITKAVRLRNKKVPLVAEKDKLRKKSQKTRVTLSSSERKHTMTSLSPHEQDKTKGFNFKFKDGKPKKAEKDNDSYSEDLSCDVSDVYKIGKNQQKNNIKQ